jgi:hypothetical protein
MGARTQWPAIRLGTKPWSGDCPCRPDFGGIAVVVEAATHFQQLGDGDIVAIGTPKTYFDIGSSRLSLLSWASSIINAAVIVLVLEAILKWVSARGGLVAPSNVVP